MPFQFTFSRTYIQRLNFGGKIKGKEPVLPGCAVLCDKMLQAKYTTSLLYTYVHYIPMQ